MENLTPNTFNIIPASEEIIVPEISEDGLGATLGIGGRPISTINQAINQEGNFVNELINDKLDTDAKEILGDFTFGASGAIKMITDNDNGLWISPTGILAKKTGSNTLTVTTAGDVTMVGTITASAGSIGGFTIGASDLSVTSGGNTTIVSSGATAFTSGPTGAPTVTITQAGVITAAGATITGSTISTPTITNIQSGSEISIQGWQQDMTFSATDYRVVAWASGTITLLDGTTYSITGANTGNMAALTYIYLDIGTSTTALQTTTTAATAVGSGKILVAVAQNVVSGNKAVFQVFNGKALGGLGKLITASDITANTITANEIAANTITANEIAANTITANEIAANTITANEMNVNTLSAISANLGTVTAGSINGITITGGIIQTSTSGQRVKMYSDILEFWNSNGNNCGTFYGGTYADSDVLYLSGSVLADSLTITGNLIVENNFLPNKIAGSLTPLSDDAYDLGTSSLKWKDLFLSNNIRLDYESDVGITQITDGGSAYWRLKFGANNGVITSYKDFYPSQAGGYEVTDQTTDSGTTTTLVDSARTEVDDYWIGATLRVFTGNNKGAVRKITDFVAATDTLTFDALPNTMAAGDKYELSWGLDFGKEPSNRWLDMYLAGKVDCCHIELTNANIYSGITDSTPLIFLGLDNENSATFVADTWVRNLKAAGTITASTFVLPDVEKGAHLGASNLYFDNCFIHDLYMKAGYARITREGTIHFDLRADETRCSKDLMPSTANTYDCGHHTGFGTGLYWYLVATNFLYYKSANTFQDHDDIQLMKNIGVKKILDKKPKDKKEKEREIWDTATMPQEVADGEFIDASAMSGFLIGTIKQLIKKVEYLEAKLL